MSDKTMKKTGVLVLIQCLIASSWWLLLNLSKTKMDVARDLVFREASLNERLISLGTQFAPGALSIFLLTVLVLSMTCKRYTATPVTVLLSLSVYYLSKSYSLMLLGTMVSLLIALIGIFVLLLLCLQQKKSTYSTKKHVFH